MLNGKAGLDLPKRRIRGSFNGNSTSEISLFVELLRAPGRTWKNMSSKMGIADYFP